MKRSTLKVQMSSRRSRQRRWQSYSKQIERTRALVDGGEDAAAGIMESKFARQHIVARGAQIEKLRSSDITLQQSWTPTESHTSHKKSCKAIHKESRQERRRMQDVQDDVTRLENEGRKGSKRCGECAVEEKRQIFPHSWKMILI